MRAMGAMGAMGRSLQERREELGVGQDELAAEVGVTQRTIYGWEVGDVAVPPKRLPRLAAALDLELDALLGEAGYLSGCTPLTRSQVRKAFYEMIPELSKEELSVAGDLVSGEIRQRDGAVEG